MKNKGIIQKTHARNSVLRLILVGLILLLQVRVLVYVLEIRLQEYTALTHLMGIVTALYVYGRHENAAFKMPWIILLLTLPEFGLCIYLLFGVKHPSIGIRKRFEENSRVYESCYQQEPQVQERLDAADRCLGNQSRYLYRFGHYALYENTDVRFFAEALDGFKSQLEDIRRAERFIFMEYHAIEDARAFGEMLPLLEERAAAGVEIRILYDDVGSAGFLDRSFRKKMTERGIQCRDFNPVVPVLSVVMNNRDHRKLMIIDNKVSYTGGYNLADEYFNYIHPYGIWKDTGIRLEGDAVGSMTGMFLEMWNAIKTTDDGFGKYTDNVPKYPGETTGFVQPYADNPLDDEPVGENVYLNMIKGAKEYVYITTPYLIITDEMKRELGLAALRGVDVRIVTPGIPDKKLVYQLTRSSYIGLVSANVRVYEYTPGFLHSKQMVCDGIAAAVGTINLDYRSLYHHFENGVLLYQCPAIADIREDFLHLFEESREVTERYRDRRVRVLRRAGFLLRLIAPLL